MLQCGRRLYRLSKKSTRVFQFAILWASLCYFQSASANLECRDLFAREGGLQRSKTTQILRNDERVLAVHLTDYFPMGGFIRASEKNIGRFGVTLHFSLGEPVIDHAWGKWSQKRYGVVLRLAAMKNQLLNLYAQDTFVLGDVEVPRDAVVFVPSDEALPSGLPFQVVRYKSDEGIKAAIDRYIHGSGSIPFKASPPQPYTQTPIMVAGKDISAPAAFRDFFRELFAENPNITNTSHDHTAWGDIDYTVIRLLDAWIHQGRAGKKAVLETLEISILSIQDSLTEAVRISKKLNLPPHARESFRHGLRALKGYLNLLEVEKELRSRYGRSLLATEMGQNSGLHSALLATLSDRAALLTLAKSRLSDLASVEGEPFALDPRHLESILVNSSFEIFTRRMNQLFPNPTADQLARIKVARVAKATHLLMAGRMNAAAAAEVFRASALDANDIGLIMILEDMMIALVQNARYPITPEIVRFFRSAEIQQRFNKELYRKAYADDPARTARLEQIVGTL